MSAFQLKLARLLLSEYVQCNAVVTTAHQNSGTIVPAKQQWDRQSQLFRGQGCNFGSVFDVEHY